MNKINKITRITDISKTSKIIELDGNYLEGGGQIVRTALALSTITGKPFKIINIRKGRTKSGLKAQHLHCIKALEELCDAKTIGASLGSTELIYHPGKIKNKRSLNVDIGTAGSITLLLQSLLLPCFFAEKRIRLNLKGGTDVKWSMSFNYFNEVYIPQIRKFCENIEISLLKRGYFPKGGGEIEIKIKPKPFNIHKIEDLRKLNLQIKLMEQGSLMSIKGVSNASKELESASVAERQANFAKTTLNTYKVPIAISAEYSTTNSPGSVISLWAIFSKDSEDIDFLNPIRLGSEELGKRGKKAEIVAKNAVDVLKKEISSKTPVDKHLADNLIPWLALFGGEIKTSNLSKHALTNIYTTEKFLGKCFEVDTKNKVIKTIF